MVHWIDDGTNREYINQLRSLLSQDDTPLFVFLGSGLSFGFHRDKIIFERFDEGDDNRRFPQWPQLIKRMQKKLFFDPSLIPFKDQIDQFFEKESALDCAELFKRYTDGPNYWDFLQKQFGPEPNDKHHITPAHEALTHLPTKLMFTTNYDELIETAYQTKGISLCISSSSNEFKDHRAKRNTKHLVKLHGSIDKPSTIVLTRKEYARSRRERAEMFGYLIDQFEYASFLFVGFSLQDPNFNILFDEAHYAREGKNPISYVVQARKNAIRDSYLMSLGVNPIILDSWRQLAPFLRAIHPDTDITSAGALENLLYP